MTKKKFQKMAMLLGLMTCTSYSWAGVGKVVLLKGRADLVGADKKTVTLKEGDSIEVGNTIVTGEGGSVKVVMQDMSEFSVGPASRFVVEEFHKDKPSMFGVVYGQVRAKFSKSNDGNIKAIMRSKSATMGIRGTEFETVYNRQNGMTSVVTFEGNVALAKLEPTAGVISMSRIMENLQDSSRSVTVAAGQYSGLVLAQEVPTTPVKISPTQFESMKSSGGGASATEDGSGTNAKVISPIPPGVDAKLLVSSAQEMKERMQNTVGEAPAAAIPAVAASAPPEGAYDKSSGRMAPPAGGFVDLKSGLYVPPPPGSTFDAVAGVYVPPPNVGTVNPQTGAYVPPAGMMLDAQRGFVSVATAAAAAASPVTAGAALAPVVGMAPAAMGQTMVAAPPPPGTAMTQFAMTPGMMPPPATVVLTAAAPGQPAAFQGGAYNVLPPPGTGGAYAGYDGTQPMYPVYNPFLCPPYCDPRFQPGDYAGNPATSSATSVNFIIQ